MYKLQEQRKKIKSTLDYDSSRKRRFNSLIELRKKRSSECLRKRRKENPVSNFDMVVRESLKKIPHLVTQMKSNDCNQQLESTSFIRKLVSIQSDPPIDEIIRAGVVPILVQHLQRKDTPQLQFEALWAISNICGGNEHQTSSVLSCNNAISSLIGLLSSNNEQVKEQAIWALGNIAVDSTGIRDRVLKSNILEPLTKIFENPERHHTKIDTLRTATFCLMNLCRGKPNVDRSVAVKAIPVLSRLIQSTDDESILSDACWALSTICEGSNDRIQLIIDSTGLLIRLIELCFHSSAIIQIPSLRAVGNVATGTESQTQQVICKGALDAYKNLLFVVNNNNNNNNNRSLKEVIFSLSNICACSNRHLQAVIDCTKTTNYGIFDKLIEYLSMGNFEIRRESTWCVTNALVTGNNQQVQYLVSRGVVKPICDILGYSASGDSEIILVALDGLNSLLERGSKMMSTNSSSSNVYSLLVEKAGGLDRLEELQDHKNHEVYEKSYQILQKYFEEEEEEEGHNNSGNQQQQQLQQQINVSNGNNFVMNNTMDRQMFGFSQDVESIEYTEF